MTDVAPKRGSDEEHSLATPIPSDSEGYRYVPRMSVGWLDILAKEAAALGVPRGAFLSLLLRRRLGLADLKRPTSAPASYTYSREELGDASKQFVWLVNAETNELLTLERDTFNSIPVAAWIAIVLADWIGGRPKLRKP
jgi:hypothetical protein